MNKKVKKIQPIKRRDTEECCTVTSEEPTVERERRTRRATRVDYKEVEVPDDDHYLCKYNFSSFPSLSNVILSGVS